MRTSPSAAPWPQASVRVVAQDESGRTEVYVRRFPAGSGKWQISGGGGSQPKWSGGGRELFYRNDEGEERKANAVS